MWDFSAGAASVVTRGYSRREGLLLPVHMTRPRADTPAAGPETPLDRLRIKLRDAALLGRRKNFLRELPFLDIYTALSS